MNYKKQVCVSTRIKSFACIKGIFFYLKIKTLLIKKIINTLLSRIMFKKNRLFQSKNPSVGQMGYLIKYSLNLASKSFADIFLKIPPLLTNETSPFSSDTTIMAASLCSLIPKAAL